MSLKRWLSDADRFGFTPRKLVSRVLNRRGPRIVSNSLPKAGTHLLERALCQHPNLYRAPVRTLHRRTMGPGDDDFTVRLARLRPNQILVTHLDYSTERAGILREHDTRSLFMVRDPRDIAISQAHFIGRKASHAHYELFAAIPDLSDRIALVIEGAPDHGFSSLRQRLDSYAGWLESDSLVVRYEDLIGGAGGGNDQQQRATLDAVFRHIDLTLTDDELARLAGEVFSDASPTFRRGSTGQWRDQFDERATHLFETQVGDLAARYGYPTTETSQSKGD